MANYTTSLRLVKPTTGEYPGTWGTQVNTGLTDLVDAAVAGTTTITMTAADYTLTNTNGASDEARAMVLNLTGTPGAARNVICPAVSKVYVVYNNTTGGYAQTLKTSAGTGVSVPNGSTAFLRCDGTNVVTALNYFGSLTLGAALPLTSGGTGQTTIAAKSIFVANALNTLTTVTPGAGQSVRINAGDTAWEAYTPGVGDVTLTGTQTLTNKTLTDPAMIGTILEDVYTISDGAAFEVDPGNGSVQLITLGASRTPKATNFAAGEAITLMVDDGTSYTITWTDTTWGPSGVIWMTGGGVAPTLNASGYTTIVLWKVSSQVYGAKVG